MTYSAKQLKAMCPAQISECSQKHVQSVIAELIETAMAQPASVKERWNIERDGDALLVCFNSHEKGEACRYARFVPEAQPASVPAGRSQHDADSAELRRLCKARDDARRERDALRAELAGMEAGSGHLSALVDDLRGLLAESMRVMKALHESATPDDGPEMNAVIPASAFHQFVDDNAKLMHQIHVSPHELPSAPQAPQPAQADQAPAEAHGLAELVALELERIANDPPISGNGLAQARVLMAAASLRDFGLASGATNVQPKGTAEDVAAPQPEPQKPNCRAECWPESPHNKAEQKGGE